MGTFSASVQALDAIVWVLLGLDIDQVVCNGCWKMFGVCRRCLSEDDKREEAESEERQRQRL